MSATPDNALGAFLKDRRARLDPAALGLGSRRRRVPGLRREEVAQRAHVSTTWYTWLEQGRGGAPSAAALERIARALMLSDVEREHVFMLALGRPPRATYRPVQGVAPAMQRVLDALPLSPAVIRTATWDVVAWNRAATAVFTDYGVVPPQKRNVLRLMFCEPEIRERQADWQGVARFVVAAFRTDVARAGANDAVQALVEELCARSPEFAALWEKVDVPAHSGGAKRLRHPTAGLLSFEMSTFAVDGRPDLTLVIYNPASAEDTARVRGLLSAVATN